jgi:hypothetical protein
MILESKVDAVKWQSISGKCSSSLVVWATRRTAVLKLPSSSTEAPVHLVPILKDARNHGLGQSH